MALATGGPPLVGACVLWAPDPAAGLDEFVTGDVGAHPADGLGRSDNVSFGPCNGAVAGEVATVTPGRPQALDGSIGALMGTSGGCWAAAARYAGLRPSGADESRRLPGNTVDWQPDFSVRGQLIGANVLQRAAGRDWSACIVRPDNLGVYVGTVHDALDTGTSPSAYGDCSPNPDPTTLSTVSCSNPHVMERLGTAMVPAGSHSAAAVAQSCRAFAGRMFRTNDPTYAGTLDVVVGTDDLTTCAVVLNGPGRLVGSLIGIGTGPLPLIT